MKMVDEHYGKLHVAAIACNLVLIASQGRFRHHGDCISLVHWHGMANSGGK